jgi:putative heme-binding domain-containing protein
LYETNPDRREQLARAMTARPANQDWPYLVLTLKFADPTTTQLSLAALRKLNRKPEKPDEFRAAILAGMKLGKQGGLNAAGLLQKWTGSKHASGKDVENSMAYYRNWYASKFPDAPPAELPKEDLQKTKYSFDQLFAFLEKNPKGRSGGPKRGKLIFTKANCIKCHRFLNEGETIGPDLTSVRRRFQRKEIIESMVYPSQVISDQYRMVTVITKDGLIHNGMPITASSSRNKLVLLLPDATRLEISKRNIDEQIRSKISVMPEGVLKDLSLIDIADLFAFLETSRFNEVTHRDATAKTGNAQSDSK